MERLNFDVDSCNAEVEADGSWTFRDASGKANRGKATDVVAARAAVNAEHDAWIIRQWQKGEMIAGQRFLCPLT